MKSTSDLAIILLQVNALLFVFVFTMSLSNRDRMDDLMKKVFLKNDTLVDVVIDLRAKIDSVQMGYTWLYVTPCKNHK